MPPRSWSGSTRPQSARSRSTRRRDPRCVRTGFRHRGRLPRPRPQAMAKVLMKELEPYPAAFHRRAGARENNEALRAGAAHLDPDRPGRAEIHALGFQGTADRAAASDIIQPDPLHAGGIREPKVAAMAEAYDVAVAPHCPLGPIALAASLQLDSCTPNAFIQEQSLGIHYNQGSDLLDYWPIRSLRLPRWLRGLTGGARSRHRDRRAKVRERASKGTAGAIRSGDMRTAALRSGKLWQWRPNPAQKMFEEKWPLAHMERA